MYQKLSKKFKGFRILKTREHSIVAFLAVIVGIGGGLSVVVFQYLFRWFQSLAYGSSGSLITAVESMPWFVRITLPAIGGLIIGPLIYVIAREAKGYGVPEVMESVALRSGFIRKRVLVIKSVASAICIGTGGSVGSVGPIIQIGSSLGSFIGQVLKISVDRMRTLVGCGAAAAVAAIFNAPLAGSMFAIEIMLGDFGVATFSPIIISSVTATAVTRFINGNAAIVSIPAFEWASPWELLFYAPLGILCALAVVCFVKILYLVEDLFGKFRFPEYLKPGLGGLLLGILSLFYPHVLGVGFDIIELALLQQLPWALMLILLFYKITATSISLGSGGSGGIYAPCLFIGAMTGGVFGSLLQGLVPDVTASMSAYATVGMGALVGAAIHGPFTAILMLFEMTGDVTIILPTAIACLTSSFIMGKLTSESIYTLKLLRRGVDIRSGRDVNLLKSIQVQDVMKPDIESISSDSSLSEVFQRVSNSRYNNFPVVGKDGQVSGIIYYDDYRDVVIDEDTCRDIRVEDLVTPIDVITVKDHLYDALELMMHRDVSILPVVATSQKHELRGILTYDDIIFEYKVRARKKALLNC